MPMGREEAEFLEENGIIGFCIKNEAAEGWLWGGRDDGGVAVGRKIMEEKRAKRAKSHSTSALIINENLKVDLDLKEGL